MACCSASVVYKTAPVNPEDTNSKYEGSGPWYVCNPDAEMQPRLAPKGLAGPETPPMTFPQLFKKYAEKKGDKDALLVERPLPPLEGKVAPPALDREKWTTWTVKQYHDDVRTLAKACLSLGYKQFDSLNVWGFNAPEWFISCIAGMYAGGKCAGLYPTDTPDIAAYKVVHSGGSVVIVDDESKAQKLVAALNTRGDATRLKAFVCWGAEPSSSSLNVTGCGDVPLMSWAAAMEKGKAVPDSDLEDMVNKIKPGHCSALIYTSGTTGDPKAVMISHDSFIYESHSAATVLQQSCGYMATATEERVLSYLPLSHVAGMMTDIVIQLVGGGLKQGWSTVFFARPYDLKAGSIKDRLCVALPTVFLGVPLVWEKMADRIRAIGAAASPTLQKISGWAKGMSLVHAKNIQLGGSGESPAMSCLGNKVLNKVKSNLGLQFCKYAFTGAAPIRADTLEYFGSLGIHINEAYGMSECTGACTFSTNQAHLWGSVGWAMPGFEVKAFKVDPTDMNKKTECPRAPALDTLEDEFQGELCFRGRGIMMGYMACPDMGAAHTAEIQKKTAETVDSEGWLHSGDKGLITKEGMTKITGRYKELIIGEGGENIAPVPIEDSVKKQVDGIAEMMMVGDQRKYNIALITLKAVGANGETPGTDDLDAGAKRLNPAVTKISEAMKDDVWIKAITDAIQATNANGKVCPNNSFKIQKFTILPFNFSEENNELTPTKKLKRKVVEKSYSEVIDRMYSTDGTYIPFHP